MIGWLDGLWQSDVPTYERTIQALLQNPPQTDSSRPWCAELWGQGPPLAAQLSLANPQDPGDPALLDNVAGLSRIPSSFPSSQGVPWHNPVRDQATRQTRRQGQPLPLTYCHRRVCATGCEPVHQGEKTRPTGLEPVTCGLRNQRPPSLSDVACDTCESAEKCSAFCSAFFAKKWPDLGNIIEAWPSLSEALRVSVLTLVKAALPPKP